MVWNVTTGGNPPIFQNHHGYISLTWDQIDRHRHLTSGNVITDTGTGHQGWAGRILLIMEVEYFVAFHYPSEQEVVLQDCALCLSLVLSADCPHNCPDLDPHEKSNEDLTYLKYILQGIGELRKLPSIAITAWSCWSKSARSSSTQMQRNPASCPQSDRILTEERERGWQPYSQHVGRLLAGNFDGKSTRKDCHVRLKGPTEHV